MTKFEFKPTRHEFEVLEMLAGTRPGERGSWVDACIDFLQEAGLVTHGMDWKLTERGRLALERRDLEEAADEAGVKLASFI